MFPTFHCKSSSVVTQSRKGKRKTGGTHTTRMPGDTTRIQAHIQERIRYAHAMFGVGPSNTACYEVVVMNEETSEYSVFPGLRLRFHSLQTANLFLATVDAVSVGQWVWMCIYSTTLNDVLTSPNCVDVTELFRSAQSVCL